MPVVVEDHAIKSTVEAAAQVLATKAVPEVDNVLDIDGRTIPDADVYDFASYIYLRKPELALTDAYGDYSAGLDQFLAEIYAAITQIVNQEVIKDVVASDPVLENERAAENALMSHHWVTEGASEFAMLTFTYSDAYREMIIEESYDLFLTHLGVELYELVVRVFIEHEPRVYEVFRTWLASWMGRYEEITEAFPIGDIVAIWEGSYIQILNLLEQTYPDTGYLTYIDNSIKYSFVPFREGDVNFGLRLVYRQEWKKLGNQEGRVIKTIPLGPKQVEKVTIKSISKRILKQEAETLTEVEQSRESEVSESESNDLVTQAANSFNWGVDMNSSFSMFGGSVSLGANAGGEQSSSTESTKKSLSESAEKSASKQRKETKLVVSTERSATDETTRTSEIHNPNEEIAITYVYREMYQKFEVYTSLAELQSVVFVPENVPHPMRIDEDFVRRHDWILRSVLLDASFEEDLDRIIGEIDEDDVLQDSEETEDGEAEKDPFRASFEASTTAMGSYKDYTGAMPDFYKSTGENLMKQMDKQRVIDDRRQLRDLRKNRLFRHIRDNILHYMRAIWGQEDPEQRMQRYRSIQVPTQWEFVPNEGGAVEGMTAAWGEFVPVPESSRPLADIINPAGPIGWAVNYAVFYLKSDPSTLNLNRALSKLRSYYVRFAITVEGKTARTISVLEPHWNEATYVIVREAAGGIKIEVTTPYVDYTIDEEDMVVSEDRKRLEFEGVLVLLEEALADAERCKIVIVATGVLQDPEESVKKVLYPLPAAADEGHFFEAILDDMLACFPELKDVVSGDTWATLREDEKQLFRDSYHLFLMKLENTRKVLVKSQNPMIDLLVGDTPALEQFKRLHRAVDVVKALEEYSGERYESVRKRTRIVQEILSDPDIENVTLVGNDVDLKSLVGAAVAAATNASTSTETPEAPPEGPPE